MIFGFGSKFNRWEDALDGIQNGIVAARSAWYSALEKGLNKAEELDSYKPFPVTLPSSAEKYLQAFQLITVLDIVHGRGYIRDTKARFVFMRHLISTSVVKYESMESIYKRYLGIPGMAKFGDFSLIQRAIQPVSEDISPIICPTYPEAIVATVERITMDLSFMTMLLVALGFGDTKGITEIEGVRQDWEDDVLRNTPKSTAN